MSKDPVTGSRELCQANPGGSAVYVHRLGLHHFAYLRAVSEGLSIVEAAKRYLAVEHGHQAKVAHLQTRDAVRAVARRRGLSAWRLIGLSFSAMQTDVTTYQGATRIAPSLDEFIAASALEDSPRVRLVVASLKQKKLGGEDDERTTWPDTDKTSRTKHWQSCCHQKAPHWIKWQPRSE